MWIIPKHKALSVFARDMVDLNSESDLRELQLPQNAMWRSKCSHVQTWLRRSNRVKWIQLLFGRILKPSLQNSFTAEYTESLGVIPASLLAMPVKGKEKRTPDTFGRIYEELSRQLGLFGSSSRMWKDIYPSASRMYRQAYDEWVIRLRLEYSQRLRLALLTEGKGYLSWATPNTMDILPSRSYDAMKRQATSGGRKNRKRPGNLREQIDPNMCKAYKESRMDRLDYVVEQGGLPDQDSRNTSGKSRESWLTPKSRDCRGVENHILEHGKNIRKTGEVFSEGLPSQAHMQEFPEATKAQGQLNPAWVEQLMGLPKNWTQLPTEWID